MFRPTRGPQKPSFKSDGINPHKLVKFLDEARMYCEKKGDMDSALRFECMVDYFKKDHDSGKALVFTPGVIGY
jgi:Holliday junction resolvase-like predicted endonuclease